ncbi:MAG: DUF433 domain-containing protein [Burkholderiales bacterium]|nr:DUF433 domain-containing protein [Burkholderiales bacterium]
MNDPLVVVDPEIQSGTPVFAGTRVPVRTLFDYLEEGDSLDEFLSQFPAVTRAQAVGLLAGGTGSSTAWQDTREIARRPVA